MVNCARGRFPIAAGSDDLLGQFANWRSGENRPEDHNDELEVTYDAHQEHSVGVGGGDRRGRHRAGG